MYSLNDAIAYQAGKPDNEMQIFCIRNIFCSNTTKFSKQTLKRVHANQERWLIFQTLK